MRREYAAAARIEAPAAQIWAVLTDASAYPQWDPYCVAIKGSIAPGAKLKIFSKLSPGRGFAVKVTGFVPDKEMIWTGGMPFGLFKGVRSFTLTPGPNGSAEFKLQEVFSGPMLKLIGGSLPDMTEAFEAFATGLKQRVEGTA